MRNALLAIIGLVSLATIGLSYPGRALAQDPQQIPSKALQAAPKGGIVMCQDDDAVYVYDGSARRLMVVKKHVSDEHGPVHNFISMDEREN